ncbi:polar amino acid ABC transporter, inner membrane subunit [Arcobacter nitrofigilis DSM 7299]|uniref:Polar amino acid ABC transporter, inner membrane subunit n=1 Tax=Arcobacter nitrofigilis (strain ATCC 33309 / DSM 7299 / CCUG 15893 / LMG 7604 / NCTC 12251 / CI) TaxID=572480 RepID=D5V3E4_ARCNC|nr:amino acid ABC transporter permease [Arcobacter nitrofigilis]ADG92726.1 polar amino acid ABC transporter, inner membrane subunit [Arcobacter nitrofigilis DSM 7299]
MADISTLDIFHNLLLATRWTLLLSLIAFIGGGIVAGILILLRMTNNRFLSILIKIYVEIFQGTPLLMQLYLAFFGLSLIGIDINEWTAASLALTLFTSAFLCEIWSGCLNSVPKGQWEAAKTMGLNYYQSMIHVIIPQTIRVATAPTIGFSVQVVKGTALASIIGFIELTKAGTMLNNATFEPFKVFTMVAIIYFVICYPLTRYSKYLERKLNVSS